MLFTPEFRVLRYNELLLRARCVSALENSSLRALRVLCGEYIPR